MRSVRRTSPRFAVCPGEELMEERSVRTDLRHWVMASRPVTLSASAVPVLIGTAMAAHTVRINGLLFALTFVGAVVIQVATNLADEYTDHRRGGAHKFPAPHKVIQRGLLSERAVLLGVLLCFSVASGMGLYIVSQVGWPILVVGVLSLLAGYLYSSGPLPLGNWALGELTVLLFMGPLIVMASFYVQVQELTWPLFWASVPIGLLVTAILQTNNLRDVEEDRAEGKHTLTTILGMTLGRWMYAALVLGAYVALVGIVLGGAVPQLALVALASAPWALLLLRRLWKALERPGFNAILIGTAKLHMGTGLLMALGISIQALLDS